MRKRGAWSGDAVSLWNKRYRRVGGSEEGGFREGRKFTSLSLSFELRGGGGRPDAHLVELRDAFGGPCAPGEEHDTPPDAGLVAQVGPAVAVDDFDDSVRELLPALALVRTGGAGSHR